MTPLECRARAVEMREYGRNHSKFAQTADHIADSWEKAANDLEAEESVIVLTAITECHQVLKDK